MIETYKKPRWTSPAGLQPYNPRRVQARATGIPRCRARRYNLWFIVVPVNLPETGKYPLDCQYESIHSKEGDKGQNEKGKDTLKRLWHMAGLKIKHGKAVCDGKVNPGYDTQYAPYPFMPDTMEVFSCHCSSLFSQPIAQATGRGKGLTTGFQLFAGRRSVLGFGQLPQPVLRQQPQGFQTVVADSLHVLIIDYSRDDIHGCCKAG